ncbi:hypothetical protein [Metarhizobium album]|uniref:hypothetical protein n=1 Tax=Metarhizobium album TaxID=2182425 RepID=UPI00140250EF|nr:hypothetical protein [Rhizobium album]
MTLPTMQMTAAAATIGQLWVSPMQEMSVYMAPPIRVPNVNYTTLIYRKNTQNENHLLLRVSENFRGARLESSEALLYRPVSFVQGKEK